MLAMSLCLVSCSNATTGTGTSADSTSPPAPPAAPVVGEKPLVIAKDEAAKQLTEVLNAYIKTDFASLGIQLDQLIADATKDSSNKEFVLQKNGDKFKINVPVGKEVKDYVDAVLASASLDKAEIQKAFATLSKDVAGFIQKKAIVKNLNELETLLFGKFEVDGNKKLVDGETTGTPSKLEDSIKSMIFDSNDHGLRVNLPSGEDVGAFVTRIAGAITSETDKKAAIKKFMDAVLSGLKDTGDETNWSDVFTKMQEYGHESTDGKVVKSGGTNFTNNDFIGAYVDSVPDCSKIFISFGEFETVDGVKDDDLVKYFKSLSFTENDNFVELLKNLLSAAKNDAGNTKNPIFETKEISSAELIGLIDGKVKRPELTIDDSEITSATDPFKVEDPNLKCEKFPVKGEADPSFKEYAEYVAALKSGEELVIKYSGSDKDIKKAFFESLWKKGNLEAYKKDLETKLAAEETRKKLAAEEEAKNKKVENEEGENKGSDSSFTTGASTAASTGTTTVAPPSPKPKKEGLSTGAWCGIIGGSCAAVAAVIAVGSFFLLQENPCFQNLSHRPFIKSKSN